MISLVNSDNLAEYGLTAASFPAFYSKITSMRFPLAVEEVLELRSMVNHTADIFAEPDDTPQYREFRESLLTAIHSFGIENKHHSERLLKLLAVLRELHYQHTVDSRDTEQRLRAAIADGKDARSRSVHYGIYALLATAVCVIVWFGMQNPNWPIKALTTVFALLGWDYFHSLPILEREMDRNTKQLNEVLRKRVDGLNWRTLIHKLSLILGYKQIQGVEVFRHNQEHDRTYRPRTYH
ncbi:MAG: hypothetical protein ACYDDO_10160 [Acidiferrobacterales bacterium]